MNNETPSPTPPEDDEDLSGLGRDLLGAPTPASGTNPKARWQPPTAEELHAILPQYEVSRMLGRGGMGAVYMGRQISLDRPVAIKILSGALEEGDFGFKERFKNEARAMAKLTHPGIVAVYDFGETADGLLYIVMEYVEGTDVARMIAAEGRLHTEHAMAITAHVCDALAYAHARGIIHRDIKPANIMVGYDGVVKVADFGLAKVHAGEGQTLGLTMSGMAMGTMHFMAPEALEYGATVDHRADLYAVGVMLFQMLTGKLPQGMFRMPSLQVPGMDPRYDGIIARAMYEDREERYQSATELRADLDGILTQPVEKVEAEDTKPAAALPTMARPQRPGGKKKGGTGAKRPVQEKAKSRGWGVWAAVVILCGGGAAALLYLGRDESMVSKPVEQGSAPPTADRVESPTTPSSASTVVSLASVPAVTKDQSFVNSLGMKFVPVPGTEVLFCIHETRYMDYAAFAIESPGINDAWKNQSAEGFTPADRAGYHPVFNVSWEDARNFCDWLTKKEGRAYRLPTDAEWSIAAGIGQYEKWGSDTTPASIFKDQSEFPWGTSWPPPKGAGNYADASRRALAAGDKPWLEGYDDSFPTTAPVMSFEPNKVGLHDLGGNLWEWVEDWNDRTKKMNVTRGGSWENFNRVAMLTSARGLRPTGARNVYVGFRVVLEPGGEAKSTGPAPSAKPDAAAAPLVESHATNRTSGTSAVPSTVVSPDPDAGWISLFNGVDLSGWEKMPTTMPVSVVDGLMLIHGVATREEGGHLFYTGTGTRDSGQSEWTDFEAIVTLKTSKQGNSGLKIHTRPDIDGRGPNVHGIEVNLWNEGMSAPVDRDYRTGSAFGVAPVAISHFKDGEWFSVKVLVEGKRLRTWLQKEGAAEWIPAVDWTQPDTWTPPKYAPNARLGSGTFAFTNWIPAEGEVWIKEVKLRLTGQAAQSSIAAASNQSFGGHRYQFVSGSFTWTEAKAKAESMGGHLATITTEEENEWLLKQFRSLLNTGNRNIWLGAFETSLDSGWQWVTGEPFAPLGWIENEPNGVRGGGGQVGHPFMLNFYSFRGDKVGWNDSSTHESQKRDNIGFIVEWEAPALVSPVSSSSNNTEAETNILGLWTRTNMETPGAAYEMELQPGGVAVWKGDNTEVGGAWKTEQGSLQVDWKSNFSFYLTPPSASSPNSLRGKAVWPDGKTTEVVYEKQSKVAPETLTASRTVPPTVWIDTQGRRLEAAFVRLEGDQVFLNVRDKETPILLSTLSPESQAQARLAHTGTSPSAPSAEEGFIPLFSTENASDWRQVGPGGMEIKDGVSTNSCPSKWGVSIYTRRTFADFILKAEFKGVSPVFNSGLWLRTTDYRGGFDSVQASKYEVGIRHSTGDLATTTGAIWRESPALVDTLKPDDWNDLEITATGQRYVVKLNGQLVNDFTGSKGLSGYIGLETNYEGPVQFRNVQIKPLP